MVIAASTGTAWSQATTEYAVNLAFFGPDDVFVFDIEKGRGAGNLVVDTKDCCLPGDQWRVDFFTEEPADAESDPVGIGDGNTVAFSGAAYAAPFVRGQVEVSYDSGVDRFPAGMTVRF